jgi:hypothetical protein
LVRVSSVNAGGVVPRNSAEVRRGVVPATGGQAGGGEEDGEERSLIETKSWDIPASHADYVERDNEDGCLCSYSDDEDDWYDDCPRENKEFFVEITRTYKVIAKDAEQAWELANDTADGLELQGDETTCVVKNEDGQRLYPIAENGVE